MDELMKVAKPLVEYLRKNPMGVHIKVIVEVDYVEVVQGVQGVKVEYDEKGASNEK